MSGGLADRMHQSVSGIKMFRRAVVSAGLGGLAYFITNLVTDESEKLWNVMLSVFLGGIVLITQMLANLEGTMNSFEERLEELEDADRRHAAEIGKQVKTGFSKINQATELFGLVEASALRTDAVVQLVKHSTQIDPTSAPLILNFAQAEIGRTSQFLKELSDGTNVTYEGEDRDWIMSLTQNTQTSIDATSLTTVDAGGRGFVDGGLWTSDLGQRYLEVQREAIQRNVVVRRVFILDRSDLAADPGLLEVCNVQREIGISVRVLDWPAIPGMRRSSLFDFVLFDDVLSYETTPASRIEGNANPTIVNTRLELRQARVRDRMVRFRDLWSYAWDPAKPEG
jgi:hypothetical protein